MLRELRTGRAAYVPGLIVVADQLGGISSDPARSLEVLTRISQMDYQIDDLLG